MGTKRPLPDCRDCPTVGLEAPEPNRLHVIAHRLSTIRSADLIVVLEGNGIAEMGTHEALMARDGLYKHLNEVQLQVEPQWEIVRARRRLAMA